MPKSHNHPPNHENFNPLPTEGAADYTQREQGEYHELAMASDEKRLYAVFSGLRGSLDAVRLAADVIDDALHGQLEPIATSRVSLALHQAVGEAHTSIMTNWSHAQEPVGTAAAVLYFFEELNGETKVGIITSGDCQVYRCTRQNRQRQLTLLTEDHTFALEANRPLTDKERRVRLAGHMQEQGLRNLREEVYGSRGALYAALGVPRQGLIKYGVLPVRPGDEFLLCTAGVHQSLDTSDLLGALGRGSNPHDDAKQVVRAADQRIRDLGAAGDFLRYADRTALSIHVGDREA